MPDLVLVARYLSKLRDGLFGHELARDAEPDDFLEAGELHDPRVGDPRVVEIQVVQQRQLGDVIPAGVGDTRVG